MIVSCAVAIALGTYLGGWRVIRTLGKGLVEIKSPQGMAAETSSAAIILLSSHFGYSLSTTHVATGSILGSGVGKPGAEVRWGVAGRMAAAWLITLPSAGIVGAVTYCIVHGIGGSPASSSGSCSWSPCPAPSACTRARPDRPQERQRRMGRQPHSGDERQGTRPNAESTPAF